MVIKCYLTQPSHAFLKHVKIAKMHSSNITTQLYACQYLVCEQSRHHIISHHVYIEDEDASNICI